MPQLFQERGRITADLGISASANLQNAQDYTQVMHNLTQAWSDMMAKVGLPITIAAIPVMHKITEVFLKLGTLAIAHPDAIANIATGVTLLGAALMGGGGVAMLAALGPAGWLAAGIIAAGAAMALYKNPIMAWLENIRKTNWNEEITKALEPAIVAIKAWFLNLGTAIIEALKGMWEDMKGALGGLFHRTSFGGGGGGFGGGGGITNAAWSGGGASASAISRMASAGSISPEVANYIRATAIRSGIDPNVALAVAGNEGARGYYTSGMDRGGDKGTSFGPYQLHYGGGEGDLFSRATGLNARDRSTWKSQVDWALSRAAKHGWGAWMGARDHGIGPWQGIHSSKGKEMHVHNNIYLDGKMIAKSTSKHFVRAAQYPTSVGRQDGRGTFMGPGAEVFA